MRRILQIALFKKEASLLDSRVFMLKTFLAVAAGLLIAHKSSLLNKDIISMLFGMMLTLEPSNLTGIRNGLSQITASILGAASTAVIIYAFGINVLTIALSIAFTLYVCLKINWREVSPVAIFTAIYMTQYIQKDAVGNPSIFLTFELRMAALITGVAIAAAFNFIFSVVSYKDMLNKRIELLYKSLLNNLGETLKAMEQMDSEKLRKIKTLLPQTFNNIDWVYNLSSDLAREYKFKGMQENSKEKIEKQGNVILFIRNITHLNYDIIYCLLEDEFECSNLERGKLCAAISSVLTDALSIKSFNSYDEAAYLKNMEFNKSSDELYKEHINENAYYKRILYDINEININIRRICFS